MPRSGKIFHNAMKFVYLAKSYPEKSSLELINMFMMPAIDTSVAIWYATEAGWIEELNSETDEAPVKLLKLPDEWYFGEAVDDLMETTMEAFRHRAKHEIDFQWEALSQALMGYPPHDIMVVFKRLLEEGKIAMYQLQDPKDKKSIYQFYTLPENRANLWGRKSFKVQPEGEYVPSDEDNKEADGDDTVESEK